MGSGFSILNTLNENSNGAMKNSTARFRTKDILVKQIYSSDMNFYEQEGIEQKAREILAVGLLSNLVVTYAPSEKGAFRLISGERRWRALCLLLDEGYTEFEKVTCQVRDVHNEHEEMVELIIANSAREKDISTLIKEEQTLKRELETMKAKGLELNGYDLQSGRLRNIVAKMLNISNTKVAEIEAVSNNLSSEFKEKLDDGKISFSAAYQLSKLSAYEQDELHGVYEENGELSYSDIKDFAEQKKLERENEQLPGQMIFEDYGDGDADPKEEVPKEDENYEEKLKKEKEECAFAFYIFMEQEERNILHEYPTAHLNAVARLRDVLSHKYANVEMERIGNVDISMNGRFGYVTFEIKAGMKCVVMTWIQLIETMNTVITRNPMLRIEEKKEHDANKVVQNVDNIVDESVQSEQAFEINNDMNQSYHENILSFNSWININKQRTLNGMIKDVLLTEESNGTDEIANTVALTIIDLVKEYVEKELTNR